MAGKSGGAGLEVGAIVAVEAVAGVFVEKDGEIGIGLLNFLDVGSRDVGILGAKMQHDWAARFFGDEFGNLSAVVTNRRGGIEAGCGKPGESTSETEADDTDFAARGSFRTVKNRGGNIEESFVDADLVGVLHAARSVGGIVVQLDAGLGTIEECRSNGRESLAGVIINDGADVTIDAEDLLDDDDSGRRGGAGLGEIRAERMSVGRC